MRLALESDMGVIAVPAPAATLRERFLAAPTFEAFLAGARNLADFWNSAYKRAHVDDDLLARARIIPGPAHLLVLNADWCGDSVNVVPYIARLAEASPLIDMRLLDRDENLDLMDRHRTRGARSIPKVIVLDADYRECGEWGPRPAELQKWVVEHGLALPKAERYRHVRTWYARDGGRTTVHEVLTLLENCLKAGP